MRISFGLRLGIAITALTVGITTVSVYYFYTFSFRLILQQSTGRLRDVGSLGTFLFDENTRDHIVKLKAAIEKDSNVSIADIKSIKPGGSRHSLTPEKIKFYHSTPEFQQITQTLRKINASTDRKIEPLKSYYPQKRPAVPDTVLTYLLITTPESPDRKILKFLASGSFEPQGDWAGNPIGNLYVPIIPLFSKAFDGEAQIAEDYYTDSFYSSLTAVIPIKDKAGKTIAVLGVDYVAGSDQDLLKKLQIICISIISISLVCSILLSLIITRYLVHPIKRLQSATQKVRDLNYEVVLDIKRQDEFGVLANIFNEMVACIREHTLTIESQNNLLTNYTHNLEQLVQERTLALHEANHKLQELANLDGLTNIFNRRYFDEYLARKWNQAIQTQSWLSLILCDVDYFKQYNDTYGHQSGDECLIKVAKAIQDCLNYPGDIVARYGGEEFAIVLPNTHLEGAINLAEQIQLRVKSLKIETKISDQNNCYVTVSMGVASMIPKINQSSSDLLYQADQGLYQSKQEGRDRVSATEKIKQDHV